MEEEQVEQQQVEQQQVEQQQVEQQQVEVEQVEQQQVNLTEAEIVQVLKTRFHDFEKVVGRKMTYAEERDYGEARDICG
jgi:hypothetical protein